MVGHGQNFGRQRHDVVGPRVATTGVLGPIKNELVQLANGTILAPLSRAEPSGRWQAHVAKSTGLG